MGKLRWAIPLLTAVLAVMSTNDVSAQTCDIAVDSTCSPGLAPDPSDSPRPNQLILVHPQPAKSLLMNRQILSGTECLC